jgi:HPr kinase/phosphorylase
MPRLNVHATALVVGDAGLLVVGASGAGKSLLAHHLIDDARVHGRFATLICDDRVWLSVLNGRLVAEAPEPIAGLLELRGYGPVGLGHERSAVVDRIVGLVDPEEAPRLRRAEWEVIAGISLPRLTLATGDTLASTAAVTAWLRFPNDELPC